MSVSKDRFQILNLITPYCQVPVGTIHELSLQSSVLSKDSCIAS
jgi:hypothetical protein